MNDPLDGVSVFTAVVEAQSFSAAARALRRSKAAVSTQIQRLEDRLGVRLLNRTTRQLSLTDEGRAYYEHCRRIMAEAKEAEDALYSRTTEPRGLLRVNAPMSFGVLHLSQAVADFMDLHPELEVQLVLNDRRLDRGRIRYGDPDRTTSGLQPDCSALGPLPPHHRRQPRLLGPARPTRASERFGAARGPDLRLPCGTWDLAFQGK